MEEKPMDMLDFARYCRNNLNNFTLTQFIFKLKSEKFEVVVKDYQNAFLYELISGNMKLIVMGSVIMKMIIQGREISNEVIYAMRKAGSDSIIREIIDNYYKEKK